MTKAELRCFGVLQIVIVTYNNKLVSLLSGALIIISTGTCAYLAVWRRPMSAQPSRETTHMESKC